MTRDADSRRGQSATAARRAVGIALLLFGSQFLFAEQLELTRNGRRYSGPSSTSQWLETLQKHDVVTRETPGDTDGYVYIQTSLGEVGWVYGQYLAATTTSTGHASVTGASAGGSENDIVAAHCDEDIFTDEDCHANYPTGCSDADNPGYDAYLNFVKNKLINPNATVDEQLTKSDFTHREQHLPDTLNIRNHGENASDLRTLGEGNIVSVVATLYYAIRSGKETCNCGMSGSENLVDYHLGIGFDDFPLDDTALQALRSGNIRSDYDMNQNLTASQLEQLKKPSVVAEMTPYFREKHPELGFTLNKVQKATGYKVRVTGQLMVDNAHKRTSDDCGLPSATSKCWRASIWEIHPVTQFEVCTGAVCTANSSNWVALKDFH